MDRLRVGRRSVLGGVVAVLGSMAGCTWDEGNEADSDAEPTVEFGYGGKPVVDDRTGEGQVDESNSGENQGDDGGGFGGFQAGSGDGDSRIESTLGVGEQPYGEQGYGGIKLDEA